MKTLEIAINKKNLIKFPIIHLICLIALGLVIYYLIIAEGKYLVIGIPIFIFFAIIYPIILFRTLKIIFSKKAGLLISEIGIVDNIGITNLGIIEWNEINNVRIIKQYFQNFILLDLNNNDKYLSNKIGFQKNQIKNSIEKYGTPSVINASNLNSDLDELISIIKEKIKK